MESNNLNFSNKENELPQQKANLKSVESVRKKLFDIKNTTEDHPTNAEPEKTEETESTSIHTEEIDNLFNGMYGICHHCNKKDAEKLMISEETLDRWFNDIPSRPVPTPVKLDMQEISLSDLLLSPAPVIEPIQDSIVSTPIGLKEMMIELEAALRSNDPDASFF